MHRFWPLLLMSMVLPPAFKVARASEPDLSVQGLQFAMEKSIAHAADWLAADDLASLGESAGEMVILAELIRNKCDDTAWQRATGEVIATAKVLQSAAKSGDEAASKKAIDALGACAAAATKLVPAGEPLALPRSPGVRPLMHLASGVQADAKIAMLTGNAADAKKGAAALAELALLVSNPRTTEGWAEMSDDLRQACLAAAHSRAEDKATIRSLLRAINERCEVCHRAR